MSCHVSAISLVHESSHFPDQSNSALINKALQGARNLAPRLDVRLPITKKLLQKLVDTLIYTVSSPYYRKLYTAMFLTAFYAFLRIGEMTFSNSSQHNLTIDQLAFSKDVVTITFSSFKHSHGCSRSINIHTQPSHCPVAALDLYCRIRPQVSPYLFCQHDGKSVSRSQFSTTLSRALQFLHLDPKPYKGHSFRIGAATHAVVSGMSDAQIHSMGRWKSDAFKQYIRL